MFCKFNLKCILGNKSKYTVIISIATKTFAIIFGREIVGHQSHSSMETNTFWQEWLIMEIVTMCQFLQELPSIAHIFLTKF